MRNEYGSSTNTMKRVFIILSTVLSAGIIVYILVWSMNIASFSGRYSEEQSEEMLRDCQGTDFEIISNSIEYVSGFLVFRIVNSGVTVIDDIALESQVDQITVPLNLGPSSVQTLEVELEVPPDTVVNMTVAGCRDARQQITVE